MRAAVAHWLTTRFGLPDGAVDPATAVIPVADRDQETVADDTLAALGRAGARAVLLAGYLRLVPARVVAMGPAQAFSRTVTIDAGTSSGVRPDQTVLNNDGLVGRVLRADRSTATVLLVVDRESVVGGRLGSSQEVGFLRGRGALGDRSRLDLDLVDSSVTPARDDVLVTWGSRNGAPYVSGVPIGIVESVFSSPRQLSRKAVIRPFVDFSALDLVGIVVDDETESDRSLLRADSPQRGGGE